jgi:predicted short-subunit dehydrogenase-like oxidoreductase (DUF2520 family)
MPSKPKIAIVGPGRVGTALAYELARAGYVLDEIVLRKKIRGNSRVRQLCSTIATKAVTLKTARFSADVIWICVPDGKIAEVALEIASKHPSTIRRQIGEKSWKGKIVFHSSGALTSSELDSLRKLGATVASVHPLMTFVRGSEPSLEGVPMGIEGDFVAVRAAKKIARELGAEPFIVRKENKAAYHAWGTFSSPLFLAFLVVTEDVARQAGVASPAARKKKMLPILRQTLANYVDLGPSKAVSGPIMRGDSETVRKHLKSLGTIPQARDVYIALAKSALAHLPATKRRELGKILQSEFTG